MLIRYACVDMGLTCPFIFKGETLEEVTDKAFDHVLENHTADFNKIELPEEIIRMKQSLARSTRVTLG